MRTVTHTGMASTRNACGSAQYVSREWRNNMARFQVTTTVTFTGSVEADSAEDAEKLGWEWETELMYDGVYDIEVDELEDGEEV